MASGLRDIKRRIRSVQSTKKITRAIELIAASRVVKAQQAMMHAQPYADAITTAIAELYANGAGDQRLRAYIADSLFIRRLSTRRYQSPRADRHARPAAVHQPRLRLMPQRNRDRGPDVSEIRGGRRVLEGDRKH